MDSLDQRSWQKRVKFFLVSSLVWTWSIRKYTQTSKLAVTRKERNLERLYDKEFFTVVILGGVGLKEISENQISISEHCNLWKNIV